jgi:hypothetical protein
LINCHGHLPAKQLPVIQHTVQFQHLRNEREAEVKAANVFAQQGDLVPPSKWSNELKKLFFCSPRQLIGILGAGKMD